MACIQKSTLKHRATTMLVSGTLFIMSCPAAMAHATNRWERAVTGQWKLTAALDGAYITSLDENEARHLIGRVFTIHKKAVKFGDRVCGPSEFEAERVAPKMYLQEQFHASAAKLRLPNPVTAVDLSCTTVFIKSPNELVIFWDGWFFDAVRIKH